MKNEKRQDKPLKDRIKHPFWYFIYDTKIRYSELSNATGFSKVYLSEVLTGKHRMQPKLEIALFNYLFAYAIKPYRQFAKLAMQTNLSKQFCKQCVKFNEEISDEILRLFRPNPVSKG